MSSTKVKSKSTVEKKETVKTKEQVSAIQFTNINTRDPQTMDEVLSLFPDNYEKKENFQMAGIQLCEINKKQTLITTNLDMTRLAYHINDAAKRVVKSNNICIVDHTQDCNKPNKTLYQCHYSQDLINDLQQCETVAQKEQCYLNYIFSKCNDLKKDCKSVVINRLSKPLTFADVKNVNQNSHFMTIVSLF